MKTFCIEIIWNGRNFAPVIQARTANDAIAAVKALYAGCSVLRANEV